MIINEVSVERKFNLGNFESMGIKLSVSPNPRGEDEKTWEESADAIAKELDKKIKELRGKLNG